MQINTIHKSQYFLDTCAKALKFVWRHVFVLAVFALLLAAFLLYPSIDWKMFATELIIAIGLDKFKMNMKSTGNNHNFYNDPNKIEHLSEERFITK